MCMMSLLKLLHLRHVMPANSATHVSTHLTCRGVAPTTQRAVILTATQFATYDETKYLLLGSGLLQEGMAAHICASLFAGFAVATTTNPIDLIKSRFMNQTFNTVTGTQHVGLAVALWLLWEDASSTICHRLTWHSSDGACLAVALLKSVGDSRLAMCCNNSSTYLLYNGRSGQQQRIKKHARQITCCSLLVAQRTLKLYSCRDLVEDQAMLDLAAALLLPAATVCSCR